MKSIQKQIKLILIITVAVVFALNVGAYLPGPIAAKPSSTYENLKIFANALSIIQKNYVEEVETKDLIYGAINGMLSSLDPHSSFMPPESFHEMQVETKGSFGGVGIEITMKEGILTVISPIEDTPAFKAGIQSEDIIIKIDGESTRDMTIMEAVKMMRGEKGKKVILTIVRKGEREPIDFPIIRDIIKIKSVKHDILEEKYGYVRITQFQERTSRDLSKALKEITKKTGGIKGLVLDLRNNPGGLLDQAVKVSDAFLSSGLIVYTDGRLEAQKMKFHASKMGTEPSYPIVVLVNAGSASASEIVAGALQDTGKGVVVGTKTFGKGSVQTILPMEDGSGIRITTARYYTPSGRSIQAEGITPDIIVEREGISSSKKHSIIREKDLKNHISNGTHKEEKKEEPKKVLPSENTSKENAPDEKQVGEETTGKKSDKLADDNQVKAALDILKSWNIFSRGAKQPS